MDTYTLNPSLAAAVGKACGGMRILHPGRPLEGYYEFDPKRGRNHLRVLRRGETYIASCPICNDTRDRLSISHRWGVDDPETGSRGFELWKCYNEECQQNYADRVKLMQLIYQAWVGGPVVTRAPDLKRVPRPLLEPVEFPGLLTPVDELPPDHAAVQYLAGRDFDTAELSERWGVSYATHVPARCKGMYSQGKIIVPVYREGAMIGWQARYPGDIDWKAAGTPKYLTYFPKSYTLYGIDEAVDERILALMEGVTDVWRYGYGGLSPLGKTLSDDQARLLADRLKNKTLVVVPDQNDPESEPAFFQNAWKVRRAGFTGPVGVAPVPPGMDPAKMPRPRLRALVRAAAAAALEPVC